MKKHLSIVLTVAFMALVAFGCKVGEDDPASLASRDGRLMKTWKLTYYQYHFTSTNFGVTQSSEWNYDGTILTKISSPGGTTTVSYALEMEIGKDGLLTVTETEDGDVTVENGNWQWNGNDNDKSKLYLNASTYAGGASEVTRLSAKELVLISHHKSTTTSGGVTNSLDYSDSLAFTAL